MSATYVIVQQSFFCFPQIILACKHKTKKKIYTFPVFLVVVFLVVVVFFT